MLLVEAVRVRSAVECLAELSVVARENQFNEAC